MIDKLKSFVKRLAYSLKTRMTLVITLGVIVAAALYIITRFSITYVVDTYYNREENRRAREEEYISDLQSYIDKNGIASHDTAMITKWVRSNRHIYLIIYKDNELFYSGGVYDDPSDGQTPQVPLPGASGGVTVDYPSLEEIKKYAEENDLHPLSLSDGTLFASIADYTEYLYYDVANIVSLIAAFIALAAVMMIYFHDITKRLARLAEDVSIVSEVDMNHSITAEGHDELTTLSQNVEQMRSSILENLEKEREALDANAELITSMSHDIRTPLTVLLGYLDIMRSQSNDETMQSYIKASESTAMRLKDLSDDMFRYFLVFSGKDIDVEMADYDARTLIAQLFAEHALLLSERGYQLNVFSPEGVLTETDIIRTDAPKLMRIVDNVFSNIAKYADKGKPIDISLEGSEKQLSVIVSNSIPGEASGAESNGIGIKTCYKLAEALGIGFEALQTEGGYAVKMTFEIREANDDKLQKN